MTLIEQIVATLEQWKEQIGGDPHEGSKQSDPITLMAGMEEAAQALGRQVARLALSALLEDWGTGYEGSRRPCVCGAKQQFERYAERSLRTLIGEVAYTRAYYRCRTCGAGAFPLDEQIQQTSREISPGVERTVALLGAHLSFQETERVMLELTGVSLSARQIETVAESVGAKAEQLQQQEEQQAATQGLAEACGPNRPRPRTFIIEMDGVQVGLQDGSWQEAKCGVIYELSQRIEVSKGRWELLKRYRCVMRDNVHAFRKRLWALCIKAGITEHDLIVVIGDGADWIDLTTELLFPGALRILDYYHASQRVWTVGNLRWGEGSVKARKWAERMLSQLKRGQLSRVLRSMSKLRVEGEEQEKIKTAAIKYLRTRQNQMRYGEYQKAGLPIGSGAVESTCKYAVTTRCKQSGMRWSEPGVDAILALRSFVLNDRLEELCPRPTMTLDWGMAA